MGGKGGSGGSPLSDVCGAQSDGPTRASPPAQCSTGPAGSAPDPASVTRTAGTQKGQRRARDGENRKGDRRSLLARIHDEEGDYEDDWDEECSGSWSSKGSGSGRHQRGAWSRSPGSGLGLSPGSRFSHSPGGNKFGSGGAHVSVKTVGPRTAQQAEDDEEMLLAIAMSLSLADAACAAGSSAAAQGDAAAAGSAAAEASPSGRPPLPPAAQPTPQPAPRRGREVELSYESLVELEDVRTTAPVAVVDSLGLLRAADNNTPEELCAICQAEYAPGEQLMVLKCAHLLHADCAREWLLQYSKRCPTCKVSVLPGDDD